MTKGAKLNKSEALRAIVIRVLQIKPEQFREDLKMGDVESWDSVAHLELISEIESSFGVQFSANDLMELVSVAQLDARLAQMR
jgi:acyl carrier protein